jgi:hypothetical protein
MNETVRKRSQYELVGALATSGLAILLAACAQQPALDFFWWAIPGAKSIDGPVLVLLAYLVLVPLPFVLYVRSRRRRGIFRSFITGAACGPLLMIVVAALSAWMAAFPAGRP